ncbi:energy transducer TonB [Taibaiella chishuiensis]|nr:energy transducer TonB [Taibaiella chishuiensis]
MLLQSTAVVRAQQRDTVRTPVVYTSVPYMPQPGVDPAAYLVKNIKLPKPDTGVNIATRMVTRFVVTPDGKLSDIRILKSIYPQFDQEVIRVLQHMPAWTPGKLEEGTPVPVYYTLQVSFEFR